VNCFLRYGYGEIKTPILEDVNLFIRSVGKTTDIVEKEMYLIKDKSGKILALRPEETAGVVRALLDRQILNSQNNRKYFYIGPMFRRERPQRGRLRQFHQIGVEVFGFEEAIVDVEVIAMLIEFLSTLGLNKLTLQINTLGQPYEKKDFTKALYNYFLKKSDGLCDNCFRRLKKNVLRILDCKKKNCNKLLTKAPCILDYLSMESKKHFKEVQKGLKLLKINFIISPLLVRGLDYYTRTVFEITCDNGLGSQNAIAAGGRYDGLVEQLGGKKKVPAFGFSAGIERIFLVLQKENLLLDEVGPDIALIYADEVGRNFVFNFAQLLRKVGLRVELELHLKSVKAQMRRAHKLKSKTVLVVGEKELICGEACLQILFKAATKIKVKLSAKEIVQRLAIL